MKRLVLLVALVAAIAGGRAATASAFDAHGSTWDCLGSVSTCNTVRHAYSRVDVFKKVNGSLVYLTTTNSDGAANFHVYRIPDGVQPVFRGTGCNGNAHYWYQGTWDAGRTINFTIYPAIVQYYTGQVC